MKRITGHIAEKRNKWYGVINLYDADGKRRPKPSKNKYPLFIIDLSPSVSLFYIAMRPI